jgi:molybdopterin converting factor small subunit
LARIQLSSNLKQYTGGETELELDVADVRQVLRRLGERYPDLRPHLEANIAVAIDGVVYQDALFQPIDAASEVFVIERIAGG